MKNQTNHEPVPVETANPANNATPTTAAPAAVSGTMSTARKLMLAALGIHFT